MLTAVCPPSEGFKSDSEGSADSEGTVEYSDTEAIPSMIIDFPADEGKNCSSFLAAKIHWCC